MVEQLAQEIWNQHFTAIIGKAQVDYMLKRFQSAAAIKQQLSSGFEYYLAVNKGDFTGYTGILAQPDENRMLLSKLYVKQSYRGAGTGKLLLGQAVQRCKQLDLDSLWLTVNRHNHAPVSWYKKQGFSIIDEVKKDIGQGFYMDDFIMSKDIGD